MLSCGCTSTAREQSNHARCHVRQGNCVNDTELCEVLVDLDNSPAKPSDKAAMDVARVWVTVQDGEDIVQAIQLDGQDVLTGDIIDSVVREGSVSDSEIEDGGDGGAGIGGNAAPPSYAKVSS